VEVNGILTVWVGVVLVGKGQVAASPSRVLWLKKRRRVIINAMNGNK
jgi:hypothetical protein